MMFKCNLTGANYEYQSMNLLELRTKMLEQFGLKPWDIYAGYSQKSVMERREKNVNSTAVDAPWKIQLATNISKRIAERDARKQQEIDKLTAELNHIEAGILATVKAKTGKEFASYKDLQNERGYNLGVQTSTVDKRNDISRLIDDIRRGFGVTKTHKFEVEITQEDLNLFEDKLLFVATNSSYRHSSVETAETLLDRFDYRKMISILDYCERNKLSNEEKLLAFGVDTSKEYAQLIDEYNGKDYSDFYDVRSSIFSDYDYGLYKKVPHDELYNFIVSELNKYAERVIDVDKDVYYQQIEITPITINIAADGKLELIDGYKRLLYTNDAELLNVDAPIKVFTELSDKDFIRLLYSANAWKTTAGGRVAAFHDRGFIFALRQRFGIRFEDYFHNSWKDVDLLKLLQIYDAPSQYCLYNPYLVDDLKTLAHLDEITMTFFKDESKTHIYERVIHTAIDTLGRLRRNNLDKEQNVIDFNEVLLKVLSNKAFTKKLASKENMIIGGFIDNFVAKDVSPVLRAALEAAVLRG